MKPHKLLLAVLAAALFVFAHTGCAAMKSAFWPAVGGGAGAAIGSLAGPAGAIGGAMVGAGLAHSINENDELRDGTLQGDGAGDKEIERLKRELDTTRGALTAKVDYLGELWKWIKIGAAAFVVFWILSHPKGRAVIGRTFRAAVALLSHTPTAKGA